MLQASTQAVGDLVSAVMHDQHLARPVLVAVGGGAGALGRAVASAMGLEIVVPPKAEVISAVGDALSLVRAERERTLDRRLRPTSSGSSRKSKARRSPPARRRRASTCASSISPTAARCASSSRVRSR